MKLNQRIESDHYYGWIASSLVLYLCLHKCYGDTSFERLEKERAGLRYQTSDEGRHFVLGFPFTMNMRRELKEDSTDVIITTFAMEAMVKFETPKNVTTFGGYRQKTLKISRNHSYSLSMGTSGLPENRGVGYAVRITATENIMVVVMLWRFGSRTDMYNLSPVESFGYVFELSTEGNAFILLTLAAENNTILYYRFSSGGDDWTYICGDHGNICGPGRYTRLLIHAHMYHMIASTENFSTGKSKNAFRTAKLQTSRPVMVLQCVLFVNDTRVGVGIYQAYPIYSWGTHYIIPRGLYNNSKFLLHVDIQAPLHSNVTIYDTPMRFLTFGPVPICYYFEAQKGVLPIVLSEPGSVTLILNDTDPTWAVTLIPSDMFPSRALIRTPDTYGSYRLVIITRKHRQQAIIYTGSINRLNWTSVDAGFPFVFTETILSGKGKETLLFHPDPRVPVMCYLAATGKSEDNAYANGRMYQHSYNKTSPCNSSSSVLPSDLIDNDCDGKVDEELLNKKDDDGDGLIDEDIVQDRVDGKWSGWEPWSCDAECGESGTTRRTRTCNNPEPMNVGALCQGYDKQVGKSCTNDTSQCWPAIDGGTTAASTTAIQRSMEFVNKWLPQIIIIVIVVLLLLTILILGHLALTRARKKRLTKDKEDGRTNTKDETTDAKELIVM